MTLEILMPCSDFAAIDMGGAVDSAVLCGCSGVGIFSKFSVFPFFDLFD